MSVYEEIINGTYKKKKQTVYESIINGTYETQSQITERQKQEKLNKISSNYSRKTENNAVSPTQNNEFNISKESIKDESGFIKKSNAFDDGYQFGDVSKTIGSTIANAGASFVEGVGRIGEGASDFGTHVAAQIVDWSGNKEWADRIRKEAIEDRNKELFDKIQSGVQEKSVLGNKSTETLASMGYSTGLMAFEMNPLTSKIGTGLMFTSASSGGLNDSYSKEGVTNTQAWIKGLGQGAIETAVERASGLFGSVGSWDKSLSNAVSSKISSGIGKILVRTGVQGLAEGSEEIASYTLNKIFDKAIDKVSNGKGATFSEKWNWEEVGEQFGIAFLSASLMGMGSSAYEVGQIVNNDKLNLAQAINEAGLRTDVKAQAELLNEDIEDIKKELKKNPSNIELTNELKSKYAQINELVTNNVFLQDKTNIKEAEAQLRLQEVQDIINKEQDEQGQTNNTINSQTQQIVQEQNKTSQNETSSELDSMLNNKRLPMQNYQYEKSDNVKINKLRQDANKYFNNSQNAHNFVNMLENIISDKDIEIRLDSNLKTSDGRVANGSYSNGVITINPNSTRAGEFIAVHELTHAIGTKSMINMIDTYRNSNVEFNSVVENILQNYKTTEINEEALADISGQLFGTQEFINNIAQNNPNIFQKIYSEIKYLWHQFRGYKNQNQFIEDLYYKWTQAYNSGNKLNNTTSYSIAGRKALENIKDENLYNKAIGMYKQAQNMAKQGKNNREIMKKTGWFKDDTGKLKFSFSDKDMSLKNIDFRENIIYKLEDVLEHDTLFMFYPELKKYKVEFKDLNKGRKSNEGHLNGSFSKKDKGIRLDINRANFKVNTEGTLIHEIQHAIQNIEGFTGGTSRKLGKRQYNNSLGEIEARDTAKRFISEKYENYNMSNILPESAKLDRNILDKMKDGLYNYFNKFNQGVSNEEINTKNKEDSDRDRILVESRINENENSRKSSFSLQNNQAWQNYLETNFKSEGTRTNLKDIKLPTKEYFENKKKENVKFSNYYMQNEQDNVQKNNLVDNQQTNLDIKENEGKQRKHYKSISNSEQVSKETRNLARNLYNTETYTPISNIDTISKANENISRNGIENTYISFVTKLNNNEKITLQDIATGERLIQIYSQKGDMAKVNELVQNVAILGTELGQQVQAFNLIKRASPEGQLMYLQKLVDRINVKENTNIEVTNEMAQEILNSKNQSELENTMTNIAIELGEQLPITTKDKIRSWRYLSMLGNPKTHIKNVGANIFMNLTQQTKNKVGGAIEDVVSIFDKNIERTKTLKIANKDQRNFAKLDAEYMKDKIDGGGKYDVKNVIQNSKKQFDNKELNEIANFNSEMLELEDNIFLKKAYQQALQNYMAANKLSSEDMQKNSVLQKAREYASYQAQEATFHQFNELAQRLTEIENKGGFAGFAISAILPFKKTPMNIAKSGIEYSPIGLAKSLTYDLIKIEQKTKEYKSKLEKGMINQAEYNTGKSQLITNTIDNMAKGLTGTSIALIGYALAKAGILKASNNGDDDEFKEQRGEQEYSIRIGDNTYTLDWISPSAIPLFIGATVYDLINSDEESKKDVLNSFMTASAKAFEPMTEMSMLQGLTSAISSYEQGSSNMLFDLGSSMVSSYLGQFVPTALGQVAKTIDPLERDTSSTKTGIAKKVDQFTKQQIAKVPILSQTLPARKDVWGQDKTRNANIVARAYEVAFAPYNKKQVIQDATDRELLSVFNNTKENVLPSTLQKDLTIDKQNYKLTSEEYNSAKAKFGKTAKDILDSLTQSSQYKKLTDEQKVKAIQNVYDYAKEQVKVDYAKNNDLTYEQSKLSETINSLKEAGGNTSNYLEYVALTKDMDKTNEKIEVLANSDFTDKTKQLIYENYIKSEDDLQYTVMKAAKMDITEYLKFKTQEFTSDKEDDGTLNGKTVSKSKQKKVVSYLNSAHERKGITGNQSLLLYAMQGYSTTATQKNQLAKYVKSLNLSKEDTLKLYNKFSGFTVYKNGEVEW